MIGAYRCLVVLCLTVLLTSAGNAAAKKKDGVGGGPRGGGDGGNTSTAILSFAADRGEIQAGETVLLSWASAGTKFCTASGDWDGKFATEGVFRTPTLDGARTYHLKCTAKGGGVTASVSVALVTQEQELVPAPDPESIPESEPAPAAEPTPEPGPGAEPAPEPEPAPESEPAPTPAPAPMPTITFSVSGTELPQGGSTILSWSSTDAEVCEAGGDWSGSYGPSGSFATGPLTTSASFSMSCRGAGGSATASVVVTIVAAPTVTLTGSESEVINGESVSLTWTSTDAESCQAGGGWTGSRATNGSMTVGPIDGSTTFSLSCSGVGGNAMQMVSVGVMGEVTVNWVPPSENVDGSPLTDLAGYRIYYGTVSRTYGVSIAVNDPGATSHSFNAVSGDYYVTMTALDLEGNESAFSNEILRQVP